MLSANSNIVKSQPDFTMGFENEIYTFTLTH